VLSIKGEYGRTKERNETKKDIQNCNYFSDLILSQFEGTFVKDCDVTFLEENWPGKGRRAG
jgi:hypothetical protein